MSTYERKKPGRLLALLLLLAFVLTASEGFAQDPDLFYAEDTSDARNWFDEENATLPAEDNAAAEAASESETAPESEAASTASAKENLDALHAYNLAVAEKIRGLAANYPEDSEVRAIYEQYAAIFSEPLPGRPTEEESLSYGEKKLSVISDQLQPAAVDYYRACVLSEPKITSDLFDIAEELGTEMFGIPYRLKSAGETEEGVCRIADKIAQYLSEAEMTGNPISYEEATRQVKDIIRYTQAGTPATLAQNILRTREFLESKGYTLIRLRNTWKTFTKLAPYRGVNTIFLSPDGIPFELQFHTAESLATKEAEHPMYEIIRNPRTSEEEKEALAEESYQKYVDMTEPDHIEDIV